MTALHLTPPDRWQMTDADACDLVCAILEFQREFHGWWWTVGACQVSRDASCGPTLVAPDAALLQCKMFDDGFSLDLPDATPAQALRAVMALARDERDRARTDGRTCGDDCQCEAMQIVRENRRAWAEQSGIMA